MIEQRDGLDLKEDEIIIARNGTPVAKLIPYMQTKERPFGVLKGKHVVPDDVDLCNDEIIDCFDGLPVSWTIGVSPDSELANTMLDCAIDTLKPGEHPVVHSDRGCHYRWPGWIERMNAAGLTRSMSKKGCSPDNSACEGFFGRVKNEVFYNNDWAGVSVEEFIKILDEYLHWYAEKRIKMSLGGMSPTQYRQSLGLTA